ncbi:MAG: twin-arginine translocase subunit TatB [Gammaproteobacteria bacterium]|nr:twin-arginine translocase subunit TatB [Gammaproteobacteria bacterium]
MFDIGFWELAVLAVVALLVVGPERLPQLVRDGGRWLRAFRRFITETRFEIERELDADVARDFKRGLAEMDELMRIAPDREPPTKSVPPVAAPDPDPPPPGT